MNKTNGTARDAAQPDKLLADLSRVTRMLREQVRPGQGDATMTAIVRLVPGLNLPNWQKISARELDQNWIALDLNTGLTEDSNGSGKDSLTGMWQPDAFVRILDQAMLDAQRNSLTLSLVLFQIDDLDPDQTKHYSLILRTFSSQIWESVSEQDLSSRLDANLFALAMPGCSPFQARAMAENIIIQADNGLRRQGLDPKAIRAGIVSQSRRCRRSWNACELLTKARQILNLTSGGLDSELKQRINMEKDLAVEQALETLVLADEKQFLFTGGRR